jgi:hypothetical protein
MPKVTPILNPNQKKLIKEALTKLIKKTNDLKAQKDKITAEANEAKAKVKEAEAKLGEAETKLYEAEAESEELKKKYATEVSNNRTNKITKKIEDLQKQLEEANAKKIKAEEEQEKAIIANAAALDKFSRVRPNLISTSRESFSAESNLSNTISRLKRKYNPLIVGKIVDDIVKTLQEEAAAATAAVPQAAAVPPAATAAVPPAATAAVPQAAAVPPAATAAAAAAVPPTQEEEEKAAKKIQRIYRFYKKDKELLKELELQVAQDAATIIQNRFKEFKLKKQGQLVVAPQSQSVLAPALAQAPATAPTLTQAVAPAITIITAPQIIDSSKISTSLLILSSILLPKTNRIAPPAAAPPVTTAPPVAPAPAPPVAPAPPPALTTTTPALTTTIPIITPTIPITLAPTPQIIDSSKISTSLLILSSILLPKTNKIVAPQEPHVRPTEGYKKKYKYIINAHGGIRTCYDTIGTRTKDQIMTIKIPKNVELFTYTPLGKLLYSYDTCKLVNYECNHYDLKKDSRGLDYVETPLKKYIYKEDTNNLFPDIHFSGEYTKTERFRFYSGIVHCISDEYHMNDGSKKVKEIIHNIDASGVDCSCDLINPNFDKGQLYKNIGAINTHSMSKKYTCDGKYSTDYEKQLTKTNLNGKRDPPLGSIPLCGEIYLSDAIKIIQEDCKKRYGEEASSKDIIQIRISACLGSNTPRRDDYCKIYNKVHPHYIDITTIPIDNIADFDQNLTTDDDILLDTPIYRHYTFRFLGKNLILKTHKYKNIEYDTGRMSNEIFIIQEYGAIIKKVRSFYLRDQNGWFGFGFRKNQFDLPQNTIISIPPELSKKLFKDEPGNALEISAYNMSYDNIKPIADHIYEYIKNPPLQQPPALTTTTPALTPTIPTITPTISTIQIIDTSKISTSLLILSSILLPKTNIIVTPVTAPTTTLPVAPPVAPAAIPPVTAAPGPPVAPAPGPPVTAAPVAPVTAAPAPPTTTPPVTAAPGPPVTAPPVAPTLAPAPAPPQIIDSSKISTSLLILSSILLPKTNKIVAVIAAAASGSTAAATSATAPLTPVATQPLVAVTAAAQPAVAASSATSATAPLTPVATQPLVAVTAAASSAAQPAVAAAAATATATLGPLASVSGSASGSAASGSASGSAASGSAASGSVSVPPKELTTEELNTIVSDFTKPNSSNIWKKVLTTISITSSNKENLNNELIKIDSKLQKIDKVIDNHADVDNNIQKLNNDLKPYNIIITNTGICFYIENLDPGLNLRPKTPPNFITMLNNFMKSGNNNLDDKIHNIYTIIDSNISNTEKLNAGLKDFNISITDNKQICIDI